MKLFFAEGQPPDSVLAKLRDVEVTDDRAEADVLWVKLRHQIDSVFLSQFRKAKAVCTPCTGTDHVDSVACDIRGIAVLSLKGDTEFLRTVPATAELTVGLMLSLLRKIPAAVQYVNAGHWDRDLFRGRDLSAMVVGIVGLGRIGHQVKRLCEAFGARVVENHTLADLVTVHVPLNDQTHNMCNAKFFAEMQRGSFFVNTSRGEVVNESTLLDALESGHLAGAALDVVCNERGKRNERLLDFARQKPERLIITPHIGGNSFPSCEMAELRIAEKLSDWYAKKVLTNSVP